MKMKQTTRILLLILLVSTAFQLPAQQADADHKLFEELKTDAEKGNAAAQFNLGCCYNQGKGVATNTVEATKWYRKAADEGIRTRHNTTLVIPMKKAKG